jgi:hypothetical protein
MKGWKISVCIAAAIAFGGIALAQEKSKPQTAPVASPAPAASAQAKAADAESDRGLLVIGYLEKKDKTITIKAGLNGLVYSVAERNGKVLFENLSANQLKAQAPELHDFIKTAVAAGPGKGKTAADVRVQRVSGEVR